MIIHLVTLIRSQGGDFLPMRTAECGLVQPPVVSTYVNGVNCKRCLTSLGLVNATDSNDRAPAEAQFKATSRNLVRWMCY